MIRLRSRSRFPSLFFLVLGIVGSILLLYSVFAVPVRILTDSRFNFVIPTIVFFGFLSVLSLASGVTLWRNERSGGIMALMTSTMTILVGILGSVSVRSLWPFYIILALSGVLMLLTVLTPWKAATWKKYIRVAHPEPVISLILLLSIVSLIVVFLVVYIDAIIGEAIYQSPSTFLFTMIFIMTVIAVLAFPFGYYYREYYRQKRSKRELEGLIRRFERANKEFLEDVADRTAKIREFCDKWGLPEIRPVERPEEIFEEFGVQRER